MRFYSTVFLLITLGWTGALHGQSSDSFAMRRALQRYTEAYGGIRDVDKLASISVEGTQIQGGKTYNFLMRKKRPNSIRYRLSSGDTSIVSAYDGQTGWMQIDQAGKIRTMPLNADQVKILEDEGRFESPLFRHLEQRDNELKMIGRERVGELSTYVFEAHDSMGLTTRYYLDVNHPYVVQRERLDETGAVAMQTLYRDYREVEGYPFAFEVENRIGGKVVSVVKVDSIRVNPGLLSFYFDMPEN